VVDRPDPRDEIVAAAPDGDLANREPGVVPPVAALHRAADPLLARGTESGMIEPGFRQESGFLSVGRRRKPEILAPDIRTGISEDVVRNSAAKLSKGERCE
jgi:hypothetical protein